MNIEERFAEIKEQLKESMVVAAKEALDAVHDDMMPHTEVDAFINAQFQAERALEALLCGNFQRKGDYVVPLSTDHISIRLKITDMQYDSLRKSMLEIMPECPKDLEIASLKRQLQDAYNRNWGGVV